MLANPGYTARELAHQVADSGASIAFADSGPADLLAGLPGPPLTVDPAEAPTGPSPRTAIVPRPGDTALLAYTSGTTGRPKAVPLTHRQLLTSVRVAMAAWAGEDARWPAPRHFPPAGLASCGGPLPARLIRSRFTAADLADTVRGTAQRAVAVPTMPRRRGRRRATAGCWLGPGSRSAARPRSPPIWPNDWPANWGAPRWCVTA